MKCLRVCDKYKFKMGTNIVNSVSCIRMYSILQCLQRIELFNVPQELLHVSEDFPTCEQLSFFVQMLWFHQNDMPLCGLRWVSKLLGSTTLSSADVFKKFITLAAKNKILQAPKWRSTTRICIEVTAKTLMIFISALVPLNHTGFITLEDLIRRN